MLPMDFSFVRDGRPLEAWLPELVSEDRGQRFAAAEALGGMWTGMPGSSTPWDQVEMPEDTDVGAQMARFARAVREAVEGPEFPKASFVRRLLLYVIGLQRGWLEIAVPIHDKKLDALETRLIERMLTSEDPAERERAAKRFGRLFCASLAREQRRTGTSETLQPPGMMASVVFDTLDTALLEAEDLLHEMLADRHLRHKAIEALQRLGPAASPFVPDLLEQLEQGHHFEGHGVLGTVARSEPAVAAKLVARLRNGSDTAKAAAAGSLEEAGPAIGETLTEEAIGLLRELARTSVEHVKPMASLGRDREDVLEEVLALAAPRPPRIIRIPYGKDFTYEYDQVMYERGAALASLRYFMKFPDRVVPVLVDAIDTFEEFDPDCVDKGEHERVTVSLRAFGVSFARLAAPVLARHLRDSVGDVDRDVVHLLGELGPAAEEALPALRELEKDLRSLDPESWQEPSDPPDEAEHPVAWAIWRIEG